MNSPAPQIAAEIQRDGPMTLARFMEMALYAPGVGYYERQSKIGRDGDFYTSVSVGSVFGELLAFQFAAWLEKFPRVSIVEAGAHQGRLAADILKWMQRNRPDLLDRTEYLLIELSPTHQAWQRQTLESWRSRVRWISAVEELPPRSLCGVIFSNEFFDAMPMHRLAWDRPRQSWREWRVTVDGEKFSWQLGDLSSPVTGHLPYLSPELAAVLPDRFTIEISPASRAWWKRAAENLAAGRILTLDYGFTNDEWLRPSNGLGTLRSCSEHHITVDPLSHPGSQDLTAHINFSALREAGEAAGLLTEGLVPQSTFLTGIFAQTLSSARPFSEWTPERKRQFQTLTHPEHLGRSFRALVQARVTE